MVPGMFGEAVVDGGYSSKDFSMVLEETLPERRDASISFQNFGLANSMFSSRFSSDSTKLRAERVSIEDSPFLVLLEIVSTIIKYVNNFVHSLSNAFSDDTNDTNETIFERIVSIEYAGIEQVYDIAVSGTHNFVAN